MNELEEIISKDAVAEALRQKIADALLGFKDQGLTVEERDGKVYVSMEAKLLFASGKLRLAQKGKRRLFNWLRHLRVKKILTLVEGHTDTDEMRGSGHPKDNWELSVLRATAVVKIMTSSSSIDPKILTAAGKQVHSGRGQSEKQKVSDSDPKIERAV